MAKDYSSYSKEKIISDYKRERHNFVASVSKARRKGLKVDVTYPDIPDEITPESIEELISEHKQWFNSAYGREKKLTKKQKQYATESKDLGDLLKNYLPDDIEHSIDKETSATEIYDDLEPLGDNDWLDKSTGEILSTEQVLDLYEDADINVLNNMQTSVSEPSYEDEGTYNGNNLSDDEVADFEDYADDYMYENLERLSATHPNSAEFLRRQYDSLSGEARDEAMRRLNDMDYEELEAMAVEAYYVGETSNGSPAAAKMYKVIHGKNANSMEMKDFMNRLYDEDYEQSLEKYKQQAREKERVRREIKRRHRK